MLVILICLLTGKVTDNTMIYFSNKDISLLQTESFQKTIVLFDECKIFYAITIEKVKKRISVVLNRVRKRSYIFLIKSSAYDDKTMFTLILSCVPDYMTLHGPAKPGFLIL